MQPDSGGRLLMCRLLRRPEFWNNSLRRLVRWRGSRSREQFFFVDSSAT